MLQSFTPLGYGVLLAKTTFRTKIGGVWFRATSKKCGTPYLFRQPLKPATSNLVHNLDFGTSLPKKRRLGPKLAGVWARGAKSVTRVYRWAMCRQCCEVEEGKVTWRSETSHVTRRDVVVATRTASSTNCRSSCRWGQTSPVSYVTSQWPSSWPSQWPSQQCCLWTSRDSLWPCSDLKWPSQLMAVDITSQLDKASLMRLAIGFIRLRASLGGLTSTPRTTPLHVPRSSLYRQGSAAFFLEIIRHFNVNLSS